MTRRYCAATTKVQMGASRGREGEAVKILLQVCERRPEERLEVALESDGVPPCIVKCTKSGSSLFVCRITPVLCLQTQGGMCRRTVITSSECGAGGNEYASRD